MRTLLTDQAAHARSVLSALIILVLASNDAERTMAADGTIVEGIVTYDGPIPDPIPIPEAASRRQLVEVDSETGGLKDAVVWVEGVPRSDLATE